MRRQQHQSSIMDDVTDTDFQKVLDMLPEDDQNALKKHGVGRFSDLTSKEEDLKHQRFDDVSPEVQMALNIMCIYLESLGGADRVSSSGGFSWEGFEIFCGYNDTSGELSAADDANFGYYEETMSAKKPNTASRGDEGLTAEELRQLKRQVEDDPLSVMIRGFSDNGRFLQFDSDKEVVADVSEKTEVEFNGTIYRKNACYYYNKPNGQTVTVGIRGFTKNESKAICALVIPFLDTVLGRHCEEEPPNGVPATYDEDRDGLPSHVQVREKIGRYPILSLSALKECTKPSHLPDLLYERQSSNGRPHNFGFVYENDGKNRGAEREEIPFVDLFAGSGGFHQGVMQVPKFRGVAAVEYWKVACNTFKENNPGTPVFMEKVEDFLKENGPNPDDFQKRHRKVAVILCSPPCQSYSGMNRNVDHNSEKDLYRKNLSLKFFDAMKTTGALVGVFENVEGMWRRPNIYFLKKIVSDHIRAGYQVRVRLYFSDTFGDPQSRPRIIIIVAKKIVEMPNVLETHGPDKHPPMTAGIALKVLEKLVEKVENNPDLEPVPNMEGSKMEWNPHKEMDVLDFDRPASTIRCGGRVWHPTKGRPLTVREEASLQSYPPHYKFLGSLTDQYKQVGNAVPGKMAKALAGAIAESLRFVYEEGEEETISDPIVYDLTN